MYGISVKSGLLTLAVVTVFFFKGYSIGVQTQVGAREVSLGNAALALITPFSVFHNQAAIARIKHVAFAIDYRQPFRITDFAEKSFAAIIPSSVSNFGFSIQQTGISGYCESRLGLAMAKNFGQKISAGLQFNYYLVNFPEQGRSQGTFLIEFGLLFQASKQMTFGLHVFNPSSASIESLNYQSHLPISTAAGFSLKLSPNILIVGTLAYNVDEPLNIRMGVEYQFSSCFFLRGGLSGKPICHSAGLGYRWKYFSVDFAAVHHETLGYTPSISIILNFQ